MPNKKSYPRLFTHVLQAVAEMCETKGSTVKKIVQQVNSSINISNLRPKPRNVVLQVRKAIQHGVECGILKQKAGKVFLTLRHRSSVNRRSKSRSPRISSRSQRRLARNKNRYKIQSDPPLSKAKMPSVKKVTAKGGKQKKRVGKKKKQVKRRKLTPGRRSIEKFNDDNVNDNISVKSKRSSNRSVNLPQNQIEQAINNIDNSIEENQCNNCVMNNSTCDNPECICNIKQEPLDQDDDRQDDS